MLCSSGCSLRAVRHTGHPQFHCGTPPPAAAPRTTTRSMIRLLENSEPEVLEQTPRGGHRRKTQLRDRERVRPGGPPALDVETIAAAYLRAAHAYMLISMPTGTSTIFGAFRPFGSPFRYRTNSALRGKVLRIEKFASEIFCRRPPASSMLQRERIHGVVRMSRSKQRGIKRFAVARHAQMAILVRRSAAGSDKELVRSMQALRLQGLQPEYVSADATIFLQHPYRR